MAACNDWRQDVLLMAAGALEPPEERSLAAHLAACAACTEELGRAADAVSLLPQALVPSPPPAELRAKILHRLRQGSAASPTMDAGNAWSARPRRRWALAAIAVAAAACLALGSAGLTLRRELADTNEALQTTQALLATEAHQVEALQRRIDETSARAVEASLLESPMVRMYDVQGGGTTRARLVWDTERQTWIFMGFEMPTAPPGKGYELWCIEGDKPAMPAGMLEPAGNMLKVVTPLPGDMAHPTAAAVTLEPMTGSAAPTGPVVMRTAL